MMAPQITILLPTYNRRNYIATAIKCIINQTFQDWVLFVLNDGGEDVLDIVESFNDRRIHYFNLKHNGKAATLNIALKQVQTPYIAYMDDDDEVFPNHLQVLYDGATQNNADFVYTDTYLIEVDANGAIISKQIENEQGVTYDDIRLINKINHKQILHTRTLAQRVGEYDERMSILIDFDYIKRLAQYSIPLHIKKITGNHYLRHIAETKIASITGLWERDKTLAGKSLLAFFEKDPEVLAMLYKGFCDLLASSHKQNVEFSKRIEILQEEISALRASFCWKITAPLRIIGNLFVKKR